MQNLKTLRHFAASWLFGLSWLICVGATYAQPCWLPSGPGSALYSFCSAGDTCVDWFEGGVAIASDCCYAPPVFCSNSCLAGAGVRTDFLIGPLPVGGAEFKISTTSHHRVPRLSLRVDSVAYLPEEIARFDGQPLHFLMCRSAIEQAALFAFTSLEGLYDQMKQCPLADSSFVVGEAPDQARAGVALYQEAQWGGASFALSSGESVDFSESWWNGKVSSLRGYGLGTFVTLFENQDRSGSTLTLSTDLGWRDLTALGWDDRGLAVYVWPVPRPAVKPIKLP